MFLKKVIIHFLVIIILSMSCQSSNTLPSGIQTGYEAINPASIIAVPVFIIPDPSKNSSIDLAILNTHQLVSKIENKIILSFKGQPNINGHSFSAVSKFIGNKSPNIIDDLSNSIKLVSARFFSDEASIRTKITSSCVLRKSFLEFYSYCLAPEKRWLDNLNLLSSQIINADSALLAFINNIQADVKDGSYQITGDFSVLLVDTNNGKLVWGNNVSLTLTNPQDKKSFPEWEDLIDKVFNNEFWKNFPGRIEK